MLGFLRRFRFVGYGLTIIGILLAVAPVLMNSNLTASLLNPRELAASPSQSRDLLVIIVFGLFGLAFLFVGLAWTLTVLLFPGTENAKRNDGRFGDAFAAVFLMIAIQIILSFPIFLAIGIWAFLTGDFESLATSAFIIGPALALSAASMLLALYMRGIRTGTIFWRDFDFGSKGLKGLLWGIAGGFAALVAMSAAGTLLESLGIEQNQMAIFPDKYSSIDVKIVTLVGGVLMAPFVEELFFRGYIFRSLFLRQGSGKAYVFSATLFAVAHLNLEAMLPLLLGGLILAFVYRRTESLLPAIIAHAINNGIALGLHLFA